MAFVSSAEVAEVLALVQRAGRSLLDYWPGGAAGKGGCTLKIQQKSDSSFVTEADFASNDIIVPGLRKLFPDDGILSEEGPPDPQLPGRSRVWILDPLDGTKSFIDGNDDFSILLALCVDGVPEFSIMYVPAREMTAVAVRGGGATLNGKTLRVSDSTAFRPRSVYLRHMDFEPALFIYDRWLDSGLAFLTLCTGDFDGFILHIKSHREWDLAAPALMVKVAGGKLTDERGGEVTFGLGPIAFRYLVASNGRLHDNLLGFIPKG